MILVEGYEGKVLDIRCNGEKRKIQIVIHPFLEGQTLGKVKKMIKLISTSDEPDVLQVFVDYINKWLQQYEPEQKFHANSHVDAKDKMKEHQNKVNEFLVIRNKFKRKSEQYEHYNELLKKARDQTRHFKCIADSHLNQFNGNVRTKERYEKILEYIKG